MADYSFVIPAEHPIDANFFIKETLAVTGHDIKGHWGYDSGARAYCIKDTITLTAQEQTDIQAFVDAAPKTFHHYMSQQELKEAIIPIQEKISAWEAAGYHVGNAVYDALVAEKALYTALIV